MMYFIGGVNNEKTREVEKDLDRVVFPTVRQVFEPGAAGKTLTAAEPDVYNRVPLEHFGRPDVFALEGMPYMEVLRKAQVPPKDVCDCAYCRGLTA